MATKKAPTLDNNKLPRLDFFSLIYWTMPLGKDYYYYYPIHLGLQFLSSLQLAFDLEVKYRSIFNAKNMHD
jgi:hypothetical protein